MIRTSDDDCDNIAFTVLLPSRCTEIKSAIEPTTNERASEQASEWNKKKLYLIDLANLWAHVCVWAYLVCVDLVSHICTLEFKADPNTRIRKKAIGVSKEMVPTMAWMASTAIATGRNHISYFTLLSSNAVRRLFFFFSKLCPDNFVVCMCASARRKGTRKLYCIS